MVFNKKIFLKWRRPNFITLKVNSRTKRTAVNKYDVLIREYLITHKSLSLEKIGTLSLSSSVDYSDDTVENNRPPFTFEYDKRISTTNALVDFISERTGKKRTLIDSDLYSYFEQVREFLNIGKPFEIEGVGILKANKIGQYEFFLAEIKPARHDDEHHSHRKREKKIFNKQRSGGLLNVLAIIILLLILGTLGYWGYQYFNNKNYTENEAAPMVQQSVVTDSLPTTINDSTLINYIFDSSRSATGLNAKLNSLTRAGQNNIKVDTSAPGSLTMYRIYVQKNTRLSDTSVIKDSIQKVFQKNIRIEKAIY